MLAMLSPPLMPEANIARKLKLAELVLSPAREGDRAKILLGYADGRSITELQRLLGFSRPMIYRRADKALTAGVHVRPKDRYQRPHELEIGDEAKAWALAIACARLRDRGLAAELWPISALARFVSGHVEDTGFARLSGAGKSTIWRILDAGGTLPHEICHCLEKRNPEAERKMAAVLMDWDVSPYAPEAPRADCSDSIYRISVDEKPDVQATRLAAPDLPPAPGQAARVGRVCEYVRYSTLSILAAIDLHTSHIFAGVEGCHRSVAFIASPRQINAHYPKGATIRVVLDNHSTHISKKTMACLNTPPARFEYVHTPKHGSWLNLIECAVFQDGVHLFPAHLHRLYGRTERAHPPEHRRGYASPVVFRWNKFDPGIT